MSSLLDGKQELDISFERMPRWKPNEDGQPKVIVGKIVKEITITPKDGKLAFNVFEFENVMLESGQPFCKRLQVQSYPKLKTMLTHENFGLGSYVGIVYKGKMQHPKDKFKTINDISVILFSDADAKEFDAKTYPILDENFSDLPF
jgi:hypothetical protein